MNIYHLAFLLCLQYLSPSPTGDSRQQLIENKPGASNIVFQSTDGGKTWKDISEGLPENLQEEGVQRTALLADATGLYLLTGDGIYHTKPNSTAPFWKKEASPDKQGSIVPGKVADSSRSQASGDSVFLGANSGPNKSTNDGKDRNQIFNGGWVMKPVESNGVLIAASQQGIIRSTDNGASWEPVISEGGVGIAVERIKGGFAAITYNTESQTRRMRTSYDGGKTWKPIDAGLPANFLMASIVEVGDNFFCGHPEGIFKSSDKGKTWKLLLPSIENKAFNLFVSGNVIYAVHGNGGC